jgi:hypothetical protein
MRWRHLRRCLTDRCPAELDLSDPEWIVFRCAECKAHRISIQRDLLMNDPLHPDAYAEYQRRFNAAFAAKE